MVCVCNTTYCDTLDPLVLPPHGSYLKYESSKAGKRLESSEGRFQRRLCAPDIVLTLDTTQRFQRVKGFGGSITDAAAINILSLPEKAQDHLLRSYFSEEVVMSTEVAQPSSASTGSPSAPSWLRDQNSPPSGSSTSSSDPASSAPARNEPTCALQRAATRCQRGPRGPHQLPERGERLQEAALGGLGALVGLLSMFRAGDSVVRGVAPQNEPLAGLFTPPQAPTIAFTAAQQRDFILHDLGPALARSAHRTQLLILDDQRIHLPHWAKVVLGNATAARYVAGLAVHWYLDPIVPPGCSLEATHKLFPDHFLLYTEACSGFFTFRFAVSLGCWERGDQYSHSILTVLNHFVAGWTDWNLALDLEGGPNWVKNFVDSPIIVDGSKDVFYKQPMFYHLGHFSKFIPEGSRRVGLHSSRRCLLCQLEHVAILR
ncbi:GLCM Glucosylceramidase, partial [Mionectes macconnelli]|nr:GLCM Glucosylceramidase [Mionectes macconnelli]